VTLALVASMILLAGAAGVGVRIYQARAQYKERIAAQLVAADSLSEQAVRGLQSAQTTADVRAAVQPANEVDLGPILGDLEGDEAQRGARLHDTLTSLGALSVLDAATLSAWPDLREDLVKALSSAPRPDATTGIEEAEEAVSAVDTVVRRGERKVAKWERATADAKAQKRADLATHGTYSASMSSLIDRYTDLRDNTVDQLRAIPQYYYYDDVFPIFANGLGERMDIVDSMQSLTVPSEMAGSHAAVVSSVTEGVNGVQQLLDALDENRTCYYDDCALVEQPSWQEFQTISDSVTVRYGQAVDNWNAALPGAREAIENRELPKPPVV
jgi:hypothetical protein